MKKSKLGSITFRKFELDIYISEELKNKFRSDESALAFIMPNSWVCFDIQLMEAIDENGDGKPDGKFGKKFEIIYFLNSEDTLKYEKEALVMDKTLIKDVKLKYFVLKCQK